MIKKFIIIFTILSLSSVYAACKKYEIEVTLVNKSPVLFLINYIFELHANKTKKICIIKKNSKRKLFSNNNFANGQLLIDPAVGIGTQYRLYVYVQIDEVHGKDTKVFDASSLNASFKKLEKMSGQKNNTEGKIVTEDAVIELSW